MREKTNSNENHQRLVFVKLLVSCVNFSTNRSQTISILDSSHPSDILLPITKPKDWKYLLDHINEVDQFQAHLCILTKLGNSLKKSGEILDKIGI